MKKTFVFLDVDGTCTHVGRRFSGTPVPKDQSRGNPEFEAYLNATQTDDLLLRDEPVPGMQHFAEVFPNLVYLTSRDEKYRHVTAEWLRKHNFPVRELIMRPDGNQQKAAFFKEDAIKERVGYWYNNGQTFITSENVIVIDDDVSGDLEKVCKRNNWTFLKAKSGGEAV